MPAPAWQGTARHAAHSMQTRVQRALRPAAHRLRKSHIHLCRPFIASPAKSECLDTTRADTYCISLQLQIPTAGQGFHLGRVQVGRGHAQSAAHQRPQQRVVQHLVRVQQQVVGIIACMNGLRSG